MKSYDEMKNDVFRRIEETEKKKRERNRMRLKIGAPVLCACLALMIGVGAVGGGLLRGEPEQTLNDAVIPGIKDWYGPGESDPYEDVTVPGGTDTDGDEYTDINIKKISGRLLPASENHGICLLGDDFVEMSFAELEEYYGTKVFPAVPSDLGIWGQQRFGLYKRDGGTGEIYFDWNAVNYGNEDHSRSVNVTVAPASSSAQWDSLFPNIEKNSRIGGVEIGIALNETGEYYAEFVHDGIRFQIFTEALSEEEMISVVRSLVE